MSNNLGIIIGLISSIITGLFTVVIFVFNPQINVKIKRKELEFDAMDDACIKLLDFIVHPNLINAKIDTLEEIQNIIYLYGTKTEINILSEIKPTIYKSVNNSIEDFDKYYCLASFYLLLNVIRHETYKKSIETDFVFRTYIKNYFETKQEIIKPYNQMVKDFGLNKKYLIK